ncbi:cation:proton antiporter [Curtobacterium sp. Leaf261]|nr:cation:proton antiporter [Curtobacterium sp. Leaf261]
MVVVVLGLLLIAGATVFGPKLRVAAPLVLVLLGIGASFLPIVPDVQIEPEWILAGILPPLLYSSAVSMPAMNFRREFAAISGLSVVLVIGSAVLLGLFFAWVIPGLGLAWGIALGAIVSPTDAVATSIVKRTGVSKRVIAILDGESLLNDATALVLLRTATASIAVAFSFWGALGTFAYSVAVALVIGWLVGRLDLLVRARISNATVNTILSFTVPFIASLPAERLGASGLVAAVVAGLVTGRRAPRVLSPQARLSDSQNWSTVEMVLEGAVFLTMGLELSTVLGEVQDSADGIAPAVWIAIGALVLTILIRAVYVVPLLRSLAARTTRGDDMKPRIAEMRAGLEDPETASDTYRSLNRGPRAGRVPSAKDLGRFSTRLTRLVADIEYFAAAPLGWRDGTVVVWAGMRGAVTVAAAQTLPQDTPHRSLLVLIAFGVAALSLVVQGGTLSALVRWIRPTTVDAEGSTEERARLHDLLRDAVPTTELERPSDPEAAKTQMLERITAQRTALLDARDDGTFDADVLASALQNLDAAQIQIDGLGGPKG